jgi:uncharacterized LabA/DUF88 family protein
LGGDKLKTFIYVDAFNLYYGAVKGTPYKWLDLEALIRHIFPRNQILKIKYFTARVQPRKDDPSQPQRQAIYLRALATIPFLEIIYGHYLTHEVWMPLAYPVPGQKRFASVIKTEEKGSDVNLASHLLMDAFDGAFDCAIVVSGDSDLSTPIKIVMDRFQKPVGVLNPQKIPCQSLQSTARFYKHILESSLKSCQFPEEMSDAKGSFHKPPTW